jgi:hypothetical protein
VKQIRLGSGFEPGPSGSLAQRLDPFSHPSTPWHVYLSIRSGGVLGWLNGSRRWASGPEDPGSNPGPDRIFFTYTLPFPIGNVSWSCKNTTSVCLSMSTHALTAQPHLMLARCYSCSQTDCVLFHILNFRVPRPMLYYSTLGRRRLFLNFRVPRPMLYYSTLGRRRTFS